MRVSRQRKRIAALLTGSAFMVAIFLFFYQRNGVWLLRRVSFGLSPLFLYLIELWRRATLKWGGVQLMGVSKVP